LLVVHLQEIFSSCGTDEAYYIPFRDPGHRTVPIRTLGNEIKEKRRKTREKEKKIWKSRRI
jgi:hypothetical protein